MSSKIDNTIMAVSEISPYCKVCGEPLNRSDVEFYLETCERAGRDPMDALKSEAPGILCLKCVIRVLRDAPKGSLQEKVYKKIATRCRMRTLGLSIIVNDDQNPEEPS